MSEWKEPTTILSEEELKQKEIPYFCDGGYMYYFYAQGVIRSRRDGTEAIMLYYMDWGYNYSLKITEVKDGYVYFNIIGDYTYQASDPMYEAVHKDYDFRVKADESRELQLIQKREDYRGFGDDDFFPGESESYDPPEVWPNPAKK